MDEKELLALIENGESETVEFKKSTAEMERALRSACAFLNHKGGTVFFGIDRKKIAGQEVSDQTLRSISQKIRQRIKPEVSPEIGVLEVTGKKVIEVKFKGGNDRMHYLDGVAYRRVGSENVVIPPGELERIILEKSKIHWDSEICENAKLEDVDGEKLRWFVREARTQRGLKLSENAPVGEILAALNLSKNGKLTNACALLFSKKPAFLQSEVKCIRFSGNEPVKPYIDFQTLEGTVFDLIDGAEGFVLRNIRKAIWIVPGRIQREEKYEYPPGALREAIINAVVHRDYGSPSKVQVRVFEDYVEVWNPGRLPAGWTVDKLKQKHESIPGNPLLFKQLFWVKYVEDVGGGTVDMVEKCREWGLPEPEFEDAGTSFIVTFRRAYVTEELMEQLELNERQRKAIAYVKDHGKITTKQYCELTGVVKDTANRDIGELIDKKLVEKRGSGPKTHYVLSIVRYRPISSDRVDMVEEIDSVRDNGKSQSGKQH